MIRIGRRRFLWVLLLPFWLFPPVALSTDKQAEMEIDHLLAYLQHADCTFIRNGEKHSTEEAVVHVTLKYRHFKDEIDSAEMFIDRCASRSTLSGKPYRIECPDGEPGESYTWFMDELKRFRKNRSFREK